jgi:hypothetical protein
LGVHQTGQAEGREPECSEPRVPGEAGRQQGQVADEAHHEHPPDPAGPGAAPAGVVDEDGRIARIHCGVVGLFHLIGSPWTAAPS